MSDMILSLLMFVGVVILVGFAVLFALVYSYNQTINNDSLPDEHGNLTEKLK